MTVDDAIAPPAPAQRPLGRPAAAVAGAATAGAAVAAAGYGDFVVAEADRLLDLAVLMCADPIVARRLVVQAAGRTVTEPAATPAGWYAALETLIARAYLSDAGSSKLPRCVLVLSAAQRRTTGEIAAIVGSSPDAISTYLERSLRELNTRPSSGPADHPAAVTDADLCIALSAGRAATPADVAALRADLRAALPAATFTEPGPVAEPATATFTEPGTDDDDDDGDGEITRVGKHRQGAGAPAQSPPADDVPAAPTVADIGELDELTKAPKYPSQLLLRVLVTLTAAFGVNYLVWRWLFSVHWAVWWIAVPLVFAETYSLIDSLLFGLTIWRLRRRPDPGPPPEGATVDVFITTYDEPLELVMATARAAQRITYPHSLWILDDGNRADLRAAAGAAGIGVIARSSDWIDRPLHAKAGNLNNALMVTQGEFIVILDADQVPAPNLLDRTLGYFRDEKMAVVQTPQFFVNVPESDPLGSQAPLFYGPLQQGKDGWNAAFFCGSNAVLRREALLQMGVRRYVAELERRVSRALNTADRVVRQARAALPPDQRSVDDALGFVLEAGRDARSELRAGEGLADVTARFQARVRLASRQLVELDLAASNAALADLLPPDTPDLDAAVLDRLSRRDWSPLRAIDTVAALVAAVDVDREDEAQPIMPMSTISVTEDMATCMRIHSMGWRSAYHDETLAVGLAPEDLGTMLTQRLRWAQGTVQVMLRENPFAQQGLTLAQKLMYTATMWSYLSGFAALAYIAAPVLFLIFGILPVQALSVSFFARLIPFLIANQVLFFVIGRGRHTWRGQQYSLALFPLWIKAVTSAVGNVVLGRSLSFAVTPKTRVHVAKRQWHLVRPQLFAMGLLVVAAAIGIARYAAGQAAGFGTALNLVWVAFDLALFSAIPRAVLYPGFTPSQAGGSTAPNPAGTGPSRPVDCEETVR